MSDYFVSVENVNQYKAQRIYLFDNVKFFAMLFCVIGHFALYDKTHFTFVKGLNLFICTFHMPIFIFMSGLFYSKANTKFNVLYYLSIFVIMKFILNLINNIFFKVSNFSFFGTNNIYWFVFVLVICHVITYFFNANNYKLFTVLSVIVALTVGFDKSLTHQFAIQRFCTFYPFFLLGVLTNKNIIISLNNKKHLKLFAFIIIILYLIFVFNRLNKGIYNLIYFFLGSYPYSLTPFAGYGILIKCLCYFFTLIVGFSFLLIVPNSYIPCVTNFGSKTLQVYFYHFFIRTIFRAYGLLNIATIQYFIVMLLFSILLTLILSTKAFSFPTKYLKEILNKK